MSITYIGQSQAKEGEVEALRDFLASVVAPAVLASEGCESCQVLQSQEDPTKFVVIEVWASIEAHRAAVRNIQPESIARYRELVAAPPSGGHFHAVPVR